jgi:hypothetical protein
MRDKAARRHLTMFPTKRKLDRDGHMARLKLVHGIGARWSNEANIEREWQTILRENERGTDARRCWK